MGWSYDSGPGLLTILVARRCSFDLMDSGVVLYSSFRYTSLSIYATLETIVHIGTSEIQSICITKIDDKYHSFPSSSGAALVALCINIQESFGGKLEDINSRSQLIHTQFLQAPTPALPVPCQVRDLEYQKITKRKADYAKCLKHLL